METDKDGEADKDDDTEGEFRKQSGISCRRASHVFHSFHLRFRLPVSSMESKKKETLRTSRGLYAERGEIFTIPLVLKNTYILCYIFIYIIINIYI